MVQRLAIESMGAPVGNQNAVKAKRWQQAIDRALAKRCKGDAIAALDELAEKFLTRVQEGDMTAIKEFGDRIDGKVPQALEHAGADGAPLVVKIEASDANL